MKTARAGTPGGDPVGSASSHNSLTATPPRVKYLSWRVLLALWIAPKMEHLYLLGLCEAMKDQPRRLGLPDGATFLQIVERMMKLESNGYTKIVLSSAHRATAERFERQNEGIDSGPGAYALLYFLKHDKFYELAAESK